MTLDRKRTILLVYEDRLLLMSDQKLQNSLKFSSGNLWQFRISQISLDYKKCSSIHPVLIKIKLVNIRQNFI